MEHFLRVLPWVGGVYLGNAVGCEDVALDHGKNVCVIGRLDPNARTCIFHALGGWQPSLENSDYSTIRATPTANPFRFGKKRRSIRGERLLSVCRAVVRDREFQHRRTEICEPIPRAVDPQRSVSCPACEK